MQSKLFLSIILGLFLAACQKEELPVTATVSGIVKLKSDLSDIGTPLEGVKIKLYKLTTTPALSVYDSTQTAKDGRYEFQQIPAGKWAVFPESDAAEISDRIFPEIEGDSCLFEVSDKQYHFEYNFKKVVPENTNDNSSFYTRIIFKNGTVNAYFKIERMVYIPFIGEVWRDKLFGNFMDMAENKSIDFDYPYGYYYADLTKGLYILTNKIRVTFHDDNEPDYINYIDNPITFCAHESTYNLDVKTKTLTWVKNSIDY